MAKRRATDQITKDGAFERDDSESSDGDHSVNNVQKAGADVMARRKIAVPRSRLGKTADAPPAASASSSNAFASLSQPTIQTNTYASKSSTPSATGASNAPSSSNPFAFLGSSSTTPGPNSTASSLFPQSGNTSSGNDSSNSISAAGTHSSQELKLRGLNSSFAAKIAKANANGPFADWTHMCEKYIEYAKSIAAGMAFSPAATPAPTEVKNGAGFAEPKLQQAAPKSEPESKPSSGLTSSGFKFNGGSTSSATTFEFGDKKISINETAQSTKPTGGFVFNANGKGEIRASAPTDSKMEADSSAQTNQKPQFTFGKPNSSEGKTETPTAPFTFGTSSQQPADNKPRFTFGNSGTEDSPKPAFSFGATKDPASESTKPAFSFGAPKKAEEESTKPAFSFGKPKEAESGGSKPAFSFGAPKESESPKPAFSFGAPKQPESSKPAFVFGKPADESSNNEPKPAFSFGASKESGESKPAFSFGSNTESKPKFSFGAKDDSKPTFSFGNNSQTDSAKPAFSFGSSNSGSSAGSGNNSTHKSSLSFGTGVNPFGSTQNDATWKPGNAVNIVSANTDNAVSGTEGQQAEGGEPSDEQTDPQTDLGGPGPGEENEEAVYEKKAKLFELVSGEYKALGLGMMRVLVHKETNKARALLRAEGSGRVLLNIRLRKEFNYTVVGKGQVKLLDVKSGTDAPTVYLVRVKTEEDGNALKDKLEEVKN